MRVSSILVRVFVEARDGKFVILNLIVMDEHTVIRLATRMIKNGERKKLVELYESIIQLHLDHAYILQKSYLNACIYGNRDIVLFFFQLAHACSEIDKIRIRHAFLYSKYIARHVSQAELSVLIRGLYPTHDA